MNIAERRKCMSEEEAKRIILEDPHGNIIKRMEAIAVAKEVLGENCTMEEIKEYEGAKYASRRRPKPQRGSAKARKVRTK